MGLELSILNFIQNFRSPLLDNIMIIITKLGDMGIVWIILGLILTVQPKTRKLGIYLILSLVVNFIIANLVLKPSIARIRPFDVNRTIEILIYRPKDYSFPSGHTSAGFTVVFALLFARSSKKIVSLDKLLGDNTRLIKFVDKVFYLCLILASFIAFSRLYLYVHYPSDVLAGIGVGLLSSYFACKLAKITYLR